MGVGAANRLRLREEKANSMYNYDDEDAAAGHRHCAMNDWIKFLFILINTLYFFFGAALLGWSILSMYTSWAELDGDSIKTFGIYMIVTSVVIIVIIAFGCIGAVNQTVRRGCCRGRRLLGLYQVALIAVIVLQFQAVIYTLNSAESLTLVQEELAGAAANETVAYVDFEESLSQKFNELYFGTMASSESENAWFWDFVDSDCPESMGTDACFVPGDDGGGGSNDNTGGGGGGGDDDYVTLPAGCPDEASCDMAMDDFEDCAYDVCRQSIIRTTLSFIAPIANYGLFMVLFQVVVALLTCLLICFNPHDDETTILEKSGNIEISSVAPLNKDRASYEQHTR